MNQSITPPPRKQSFRSDIAVMRLFLIILLIIYHSFAPFSGNWEAIGTKADIPTYRWIGNFSYSFFLESFVFISGLLLGSRSIKKPLGNEDTVLY